MPICCYYKYVQLLQTKVAHLLGVVGTDVPESDLREAMSPHIVSTFISL